jgi:DNA polymerase (family X)
VPQEADARGAGTPPPLRDAAVEVEILAGGQRLVVAAHGEEDRPPERVALAPSHAEAGDVHPVEEDVACTEHDAVYEGGLAGVDGDPARGSTRLLGRIDQGGQETVQVVGEANVGVEEEQDAAARGAGAGVAARRDRLAARSLVADHPVGEILGDGERRVRGTAIGDDDVEPMAAAHLGGQLVQQRSEPLLFVERGNDDGGTHLRSDGRRNTTAARVDTLCDASRHGREARHTGCSCASAHPRIFRMTNKHVARILRHTAALIELTGGNAFRARAYASAGRTVDMMPEPVGELVATSRLREVQGIGQGIAADIESFVRTGSFDTLETLLQTIPPGLLDVLQIKGLGPKKVRVLWQQLGVTSLDDLEVVATTGQIAQLDGFGKKTEQKLLDEVHRLRSYLGQRHFYAVADEVALLLDALRDAEGVERAEAAGDLRRRNEVIERVEMVVAGSEEVLRSVLLRHAEPGDEDEEDAFFVGTLDDGLPLVVYRADVADFGRVWWRRTGSAAHVAAFVEQFGEPETTLGEEELYRAAGLDLVPPPLREGTGEIEAAAAGRLPRLITSGDLLGSIHNHSTYSDGAHTVRAMAEAARAMGYEYFGIADHSHSLRIANGLPIERLREQAEEVHALNHEFAHDGGAPFRIFHGTECDILADGSLDYPDDVLADLDYVVASIHTGFAMTEEEATERIIRAVSHPLVDVLGHPTGRLLLRRDGYPVNHDAVIDACAAYGVAIELNANPYRLDVDWRHLRNATEKGVLIAINPDAHSTDGLADVQWGVAVAQKGWLTAEQCLNAKSADDFASWLEARRARAAYHGDTRP